VVTSAFVAAAAAALCASAGARGTNVGFSGLPSQVYEGQTTVFAVDLSNDGSIECTLAIHYTGKRVDRVTHLSRNGHASWRIRIPAVPPGPANLVASCAGLSTATSQVLVQWALQTPKLTVAKRGFTETFDQPNGTGTVSYGLAIHNERVRFDATSVAMLVNFVDGTNRVLGTDHVGIGRIPAGTTVYYGAQVGVPYGQNDLVTRLEVVLVQATSSQKVPSTPLLISDVQLVPDGNQTTPHIDSVRGQLLNQSKLQLQGADLGIVVLDSAGNILGGGTGGGGGPLSQGSREFFSSCCSYSKIQLANAASVLISAVPSYNTNQP
jgi:hypothetical protein